MSTNPTNDLVADNHQDPDMGGTRATYFAPSSSIGIECYTINLDADTLTVLSGRTRVQRSRVVSVWFPSGTVPQQNGTIAIAKTLRQAAATYRVVSAEPDREHISYQLDLEPQ